MIARRIHSIRTAQSPGEFRAVALDQDNKPARVFSQIWSGMGAAATYGSVHDARLRRFADELRGAFCQLPTGEDVFLRLKSREGLTEGAAIRVKVESEARADKVARVSLTQDPVSESSAYEMWLGTLDTIHSVEVAEDQDRVAAAFDDALAPSVTLPGGGVIHIANTRALTAVDIDTAGRRDKGSAGARALAINRDAVMELARQVSLRDLAGLIVLDCVGPINANAAERLRDAGRAAFEAFGLPSVRVLKPSALGLLEMSISWRFQPLHDKYSKDPAERKLLDILRETQREAERARHKFFHLALCADAWRAYERRKLETDRAISEMFSGRVTIVRSNDQTSEVIRL